MTVVILGCGYTGVRVARLCLEGGARVIATSRSLDALASLTGAELIPLDVTTEFDLDFVPEGSALLHSIPPVSAESDARLVQQLAGRPRRIVYISTTGVYGRHPVVDENTPADAVTPESAARVAVEGAVLAGPWSGLVLRAAAIYGPGRGIHVRMARGDFQLAGPGDNFVSRIHVDDLAALAYAGLVSGIEGSFPVADDEPCTQRQIAEFCTELLQVPAPAVAPPDSLHPTRRADRRVDGSAIRRLLGVNLKYPTYRIGIPQSL
jgi:nucleoside-diphosphate-sugar epimerase